MVCALQAEARAVFKHVCTMQQQGLALEKPAVATDVAIGNKIPLHDLACCFAQHIAEQAAAAGKWLLSAAPKNVAARSASSHEEAVHDHPFALQLVNKGSDGAH